MARFMDFHEDLKLPAEAIAQIAEDTRNAQGRSVRRRPRRFRAPLLHDRWPG
jgi:hypothetical protein